MISLYDYLYKNVTIITTDGEKYTGYVDFFESPYENESDEDSIGLLDSKNSHSGIELYQSQIKSIEILS